MLRYRFNFVMIVIHCLCWLYLFTFEYLLGSCQVIAAANGHWSVAAHLSNPANQVIRNKTKHKPYMFYLFLLIVI